MTHTVESLLKLADAYSDCCVHLYEESRVEARATLQAALSELVAENESLRKDAERYRKFVAYMLSFEKQHDDAIVAARTHEEVTAIVDSMKGTPT